MEYDLELDRIVKEINSSNSKKVLVQLPDGLKSKAAEIVDFLSDNTKSEIFLWMGSNFGACDLPLDVEKVGINLLINFGHSKVDTT